MSFCIDRLKILDFQTQSSKALENEDTGLILYENVNIARKIFFSLHPNYSNWIHQVIQPLEIISSNNIPASTFKYEIVSKLNS